jgi:hypothetical protein
MRTQLTKLIPCAVAVLAFAGLSSAQLTTNQEHEWLNSPAASSHVGRIGRRQRGECPVADT